VLLKALKKSVIARVGFDVAAEFPNVAAAGSPLFWRAAEHPLSKQWSSRRKYRRDHRNTNHPKHFVIPD
jgi:hypothetical protein